MSELINVTSKLTLDQHAALKEICSREHRTMTATVEMLVIKYIEENKDI